MGQFNVFVFVTHAFVVAPITTNSLYLQPFTGVGVRDVSDLIAQFAASELGQPVAPQEKRDAESSRIAADGASVVISIDGIEAGDHVEAIQSTEDIVTAAVDVLALRQMQRGAIAGFLSIRTDVAPPELYSQARRPYGLLRKIVNLPVGDTESDIFGDLAEKSSTDLRLRVYLALYSEAVARSSTSLTDNSWDVYALKLWNLLETMAFDERGTTTEKVKALFGRYQLTPHPDYRGHTGRDLVDIAYQWRNVVVHAGGRAAATSSRDREFCEMFSAEFEHVREELAQSVRFLIHAYARSLR